MATGLKRYLLFEGLSFFGDYGSRVALIGDSGEAAFLLRYAADSDDPIRPSPAPKIMRMTLTRPAVVRLFRRLDAHGFFSAAPHCDDELALGGSVVDIRGFDGSRSNTVSIHCVAHSRPCRRFFGEGRFWLCDGKTLLRLQLYLGRSWG